MTTRKREGSLTTHEKNIVKSLLNRGWHNQDIQALVNIGRKATVNSRRITGVKKDKKQKKPRQMQQTYSLGRKNIMIRKQA